MKSILVTGANGQLGKCVKDVSKELDDGLYKFIFVGREELDISDEASVESFFLSNEIDCVINCAAYTAVDNAEKDIDNASLINAEAVKFLAKECEKIGAFFIHISTDYVFDGEGTEPYKETDKTNPISVYGETKLKGEEYAIKYNPKTIIIRTAWVYSQYGKNFVKTMLRLFAEREEISVVNDQIGTPTNANDIAMAIMQIIQSKEKPAGVYHFTNEGQANWFEFANAIKEITNSDIKINPIPTTAYPTPAMRPKYSVLCTNKIKETFGLDIMDWKESLRYLFDEKL